MISDLLERTKSCLILRRILTYSVLPKYGELMSSQNGTITGTILLQDQKIYRTMKSAKPNLPFSPPFVLALLLTIK